MLIWTPAETERGGGSGPRGPKRADEAFTEASAGGGAPRPATGTDDVLLLPSLVRETPRDLIDEGAWCAADHAVGTPGRRKVARADWIEESARRILIDAAYGREIEWLADMGNDSAKSAIEAAHRIDSAKR